MQPLELRIARSSRAGSSLTILYNGTHLILSVTDNAAIDITGGSLEVTSGASQVSGALPSPPARH